MQAVISRSEGAWAWVPVKPQPTMPASVTIRVPTTPQWVIECVESEMESAVSGMCRMNGSTAVILMPRTGP